MAGRVALLMLALAHPLAGQDSVTVVADARLGRGGLHRLLFGADYRDLWTASLRVPVLDLSREAGGLTPIRRGGGLQTRSLRFRAADGRQFVFRVLEKDPSQVLPAELRGTFVEDIVHDQMAAMHPGGALVVPPILAAAGVLHVTPRLAILPDDGLGEFRAEFAGRLGTLELRPTDGDDDHPGFAGARRIVSTRDLITALWREPWIPVDAHAFLTARLLDLFLGDWDRHEDQWRWALVGDGDAARWQPIPRDRDWVFARYEGLLLGLARRTNPQLLKFGERYGAPVATTWNGRNLDRRLLVSLERAVWDSTARFLQAAITDSVLDEAVGRLPPEYRTGSGADLRATLARRRERLGEEALRFYRFLARQVRIQAGDGDDRANILRHEGGRTEVRLARADGPEYFRRLFEPGETVEIQLDLRGGDDVAVIRGGDGGPMLRIIGGSGVDVLADSSAGGRVRFYDRGDRTIALNAPLDRTHWVQPADTSAAALPQRDWGTRQLSWPLLYASSDLGLTAGFEWRRLAYGFRRQPYATSLAVGAIGSFGRTSGRVTLDARRKAEARDRFATLDLMASGIEVLRFHGFGNGTRRADGVADEYYRVRQEAFEVAPGVAFGLEGRARARLRIRARHTITDTDDPTNRDGLIGALRPHGIGAFGQLGLAGRLEWDSRDTPTLPTRGVHVLLDADWSPVTWSGGGNPFGSAAASATAFVTPGRQDRFTAAVRLGARRVWGDYPWFEATFLGGAGSLPGYHRNRFAGDAGLFGGVDLRFQLARTRLLVPGEFGVIALADIGRVFTDKDSSLAWHSDAGGGIYYAILSRSAAFRLIVARGGDATRFYLR